MVFFERLFELHQGSEHSEGTARPFVDSESLFNFPSRYPCLLPLTSLFCQHNARLSPLPPNFMGLPPPLGVDVGSMHACLPFFQKKIPLCIFPNYSPRAIATAQTTHSPFVCSRCHGEQGQHVDYAQSWFIDRISTFFKREGKLLLHFVAPVLFWDHVCTDAMDSTTHLGNRLLPKNTCCTLQRTRCFSLPLIFYYCVRREGVGGLWLFWRAHSHICWCVTWFGNRYFMQLSVGPVPTFCGWVTIEITAGTT